MPRLFDFFEQLAANNNREWFHANKAEYDELRELWLADLDRMIAAMQQWQPELAGITARQSAYRIYRDTRFSTDKTPYKTFFSAAVSPFGRSSEYAGCYIQIGIGGFAESNCLYGGIWCPASPVLRKLRHAIVDNIEEWEEITSNPDLKKHFTICSSSSLKTIPKGWPKDHPQAHWLRMNDYGLEANLGREFFMTPDWPEKAAKLFSYVKPFNDFLNYSINEDV